MNKPSFAKLAAGSLVLGTALVGSGPAGQQLSAASAQTADRSVAAAATTAKNARKAIAKGNFEKAVSLAERAVALQPVNAGYRMLLGETYLSSGRFASAETSFGDVLDLNPGNERAALRLALTKIALGKNEAARSVLDEHRASLPAADYGLAVALSGDYQGAIAILEEVIRSPQADGRARQNLAMAYALSGKWVQARVMASQDLSADLIDGRMTQWAALSRPKSASDQVASVLGVKPVYDAGQPVALALNGAPRSAPVQTAAVTRPVEVEQAPAAADVPAAAFEIGDANETSAPVAEISLAEAAATPAAQQVVFRPRQEIVQQIRTASRKVPLVRADKKPMRVASAAVPKARPAGRKNMIVETVNPRTGKLVSTTAPKLASAPAAKPVKTAAAVPAAKPAQTIVSPKTGKQVQAGQFVVQLGAFANKAQAEAAWNSASRKVGGLANHNAVTAQVAKDGKDFHRLAVSGFKSADEANALCAKVKASGGQCFVKGASSDGSRWAALKSGKPVQLASR